MSFLENLVSKLRGEVRFISDKGTLVPYGLKEASGDQAEKQARATLCQFSAACRGFLWKRSEALPDTYTSSRQNQAEKELSKRVQQPGAEVSAGGRAPAGRKELHAAVGPGTEAAEGNRGCALRVPGNCSGLLPPGAARFICKENIVRKEPVQINSLVVIEAMSEKELPGLLILDIGGTYGVQENIVALLKKHFCLITMKEFLENKKEMSKKIQSVFVSECRPTVDQELLESLPNLKVIGNSGVGVDHLNLKMISNFGVKVTNTPHAVADSTADIGMALMLASARRLVEGALIDQDALVEALQNNVIRAAALDVTYPEPLPRDHPLLKLNNIIITPHIGTATVQAIQMMAEEAIANMLAVLNGQPIPSEVFPK